MWPRDYLNKLYIVVGGSLGGDCFLVISRFVMFNKYIALDAEDRNSICLKNDLVDKTVVRKVLLRVAR